MGRGTRRKRLRFVGSALLVVMATFTIAGESVAQTTAQIPPPAPSNAISLVVKGAVQSQLRFTADEWKVMARARVSAKDHGGVEHSYEGVTLQALLLQAGVPQGDTLRGKSMMLVVVAEGTDGYRAAFSVAELDGDFSGAQVLVADTVDGKPLAVGEGPLRLVVPGDKRQARAVRMLKSITVVNAGATQ
jgi:DMSO/TMAO reductase YedYZ molybdopterin-dependent catalytic subunit